MQVIIITHLRHIHRYWRKILLEVLKKKDSQIENNEIEWKNERNLIDKVIIKCYEVTKKWRIVKKRCK